MALDLQGIFQSCFDPTQNALRIVAKNDSIQYGMALVDPGTSTYVSSSGTDTVAPRCAFDPATVQRIKFQFVAPLTWQNFNVALMVFNDTGGAGNITWRFKYQGIVLASGASDALTLGSTLTHAAPAGALSGISHVVFPDVIPIVNGGFGERPEYQCVIDRFASDASDTLANNASIALINFIRA